MAGTQKIAAILVADIVGYSRLAGADEDRTLSRLRGLRSDLIDPAIDLTTGASSSEPATAASSSFAAAGGGGGSALSRALPGALSRQISIGDFRHPPAKPGALSE